MPIVVIEAAAPVASWRPPEALTYHRTLPLPPYTTLVGMLGAALGLGLPDAYRFVAERSLRLGIPIRSDNVDYLQRLVERLTAEGIRAEVDASDDRMQKKILHAQQQKVPFMFVAGDRDVEAGAVSIRYRNGVERRGVPIDDAIQEVARNVASRQIEPDALNPETTVDA